jgi:hypothetical protein
MMENLMIAVTPVIHGPSTRYTDLVVSPGLAISAPVSGK